MLARIPVLPSGKAAKCPFVGQYSRSKNLLLHIVTHYYRFLSEILFMD